MKIGEKITIGDRRGRLVWQLRISLYLQNQWNFRPRFCTLEEDTKRRRQLPSSTSSCKDTVSLNNDCYSKKRLQISDRTVNEIKYQSVLKSNKKEGQKDKLGNFFYLNGNWINNATNFETPLFKLHYRSIINASPFRKNKYRRIRWIRHVLLQSLN